MNSFNLSSIEAGPALDWLVGRALGWSLKKTSSMMSPEDGWGRSLPGEPFKVEDAWPVWHDQSGRPVKWPRFFKIQSRQWTPSSDEEFLGRLVGLFQLDISRTENGWKVFADQQSHLAQHHEALLVASCRAIVASRLGVFVDVPDDPLHSGD